MGQNRRRILTLALYAAPVLLAMAIRAGLPTYYEFESQEDTLRAMTMLEHGDLPLYGIGHIRFLGAALGPLVYYVKAIPLLLNPHPVSEVAFLVLLHLAAIVAAMLLVRDVVRDLIRADFLKGYSAGGWAPTAAASATGFLLALSIYAHAITLHAHAAFFAGAFVPILTLGVYRWCTGGSRGWLVLAGLSLGIMTQFYQLALFAPLLIVLAWVGPRRRLTRPALVAFLVPFAVCYIPYFVSELSTGFANTAGFFQFEPGPQDEASVGFSLANNGLFFLATISRHFGQPAWTLGLLLILAGTGLVSAVAALRRTPGITALLALGFVYTLLPMLLLKSVRFELSHPFGQALIVIGALVLWPRLRRAWTLRQWLPLVAAVAALVVSALFPYARTGREVAHVAVTPIRMESASPIGGMPTLAESEAVLRHLRQSVALESSDATAHIASPVVLSGYFGHRYLLRVLEGQSTAAGDLEELHFITDDRFPAVVRDGKSERFEGFDIHRLDTRVEHPSVQVGCSDEWCLKASRAPIPYLVHRFFWGCGEYRDLDRDLALPRHECEDVLTAPPHNRVYRGQVHWAPRAADCADCERLVFVIHDPGCRVAVKTNDGPAQQLLFAGMKRDYTLARVSGDRPLSDLAIEVPDCHSYSFVAIPFVGIVVRQPGESDD